MELAEIKEVSTSIRRNRYGGKLSEKQANHLHELINDPAGAIHLRLVHWWRIDSPVTQEALHFRIERENESKISDPEIEELYNGWLKFDIESVGGWGGYGKPGRNLARALIEVGAEPDRLVQRQLAYTHDNT